MALFLPTYFSPISQYIAISKAASVLFEAEDNFQKQTYRNRCYIYGPNGRQLLNIPIKHLGGSQKKKTKDTLIDHSVAWQNQHLKSLQIAYRNSPFYEFYEDDMSPIFTKKHKYLIDLNIDTHLFIADALQIDDSYLKTTTFSDTVAKDYRHLANAKKELNIEFHKYVQVFDDKHGFIPNLSILDLLFMEGPNTISYLENIPLI